MRFTSFALAAILSALPLIATADSMNTQGAYARASSPMAQSGAAFMAIHNASGQDDRLIAALSDVAERIELHTHIMDGDGVMRMREMQNGIAIPQGETVTLERGGLHIMLLGLTRPLEQGDEFELVLQFEHHAPLTLMVPVDLNHGTGHGHNHSNHTN